jgi:hypothetical protein
MSDLELFLFGTGYGPTTGSLVDYLYLLGGRERKPNERMQQRLRFLNWQDEINPVWKPRILTESARSDLKKGKNPARING